LSPPLSSQIKSLLPCHIFLSTGLERHFLYPDRFPPLLFAVLHPFDALRKSSAAPFFLLVPAVLPIPYTPTLVFLWRLFFRYILSALSIGFSPILPPPPTNKLACTFGDRQAPDLYSPPYTAPPSAIWFPRFKSPKTLLVLDRSLLRPCNAQAHPPLRNVRSLKTAQVFCLRCSLCPSVY